MNSFCARKVCSIVVMVAMAVTLAAVPALAAQSKSLGKLTAVEVQGNSRIDSETILKQVTLKIGDDITEEAVNETFARLDSMGWFSDLNANTVQYLGGLKLIFVVREFPVLKSVSIAGNQLIPTDELAALMTTRAGEQLNAATLRSDLEKISKLYSDKGYWVSIEPSLQGDAELAVHLVEWTVSEIKLEGLGKTKPAVARRSISLKEGEFIDVAKINNDRRALYMLGAFEDVQAKVEPVAGKPEFTVTYIFTERKTGVANINLSYSSSTGIMGYLELGDENFLGNAQRINAKAEFGWGKANYELGFFEPWLGKTGKMSLGLNLYNKTADKKYTPESEGGEGEDPVTIPYSQRRTGADVSLGTSLSLNTKVFLKLKMDNVVNTTSDPAGPEGLPAGGITRSITLSAVNDARNDLWNPSDGHRLSGSIEYAGGILGGDYSFTKVQAEGAGYVQIHDGHVLAGRVSGGWGLTPLPEQERFILGGAETVRGYKYGDLEGDRMAYANAEYRFRIIDSLQGVAFVDAGQAWNAGESLDIKNTKIGYGVGVRLNVPVLGTIRVDYGISKQGGQLYFSFGQTF
ncbi:MAG: Outer membrane protein assembly factor BamA precursor [Firmicutes bacterium ADurb.Bin506]|nr:MAG: Outer membrane protein assembly factor BamA precursor [Firmicutes bacterium ADurb.Bin506]